MDSNWRKIENEEGYPCFIDNATGKTQFNHPQFTEILESLEVYNGIKYNAYRTAFKIFTLQRHLRVPPLRISSGVFARHQLSLSESSLSLDTTELEAVLADIYFAAEKEGLFTGDVDTTVDLMINLLLNVYDGERKQPIRVLAAKTLLIILSEESASDKWFALANCSADHNGCVSPKRLAALLSHMTALPEYLGSKCDQIQVDVDTCFEKSAGMLGINARTVAEWGINHCVSAQWLSTVQRVVASRNCSNVSASCAACLNPLIQVLKFECSKCNETYFCENCYLYDKDMTSVYGHKKMHLVHEIIDGEMKPQECLSFIRSMRRFFFCTKTKKKKTCKKSSKKSSDKVDSCGTMKRRKDGRPAIFTSTVGKASGKSENNPASMLQDIISQLEQQNKALQELSNQLKQAEKEADNELKLKVDSHWDQISTQINRLKILKENLTQNLQVHQTENPQKTDRPQAFDLFSPIPIIDEKTSKVNNVKTQPRVLSLDSGNFSVMSRHTDCQNLLTMSRDGLRPVQGHATTDSISTVSMNDISNWYNDADPNKNHLKSKVIDATSHSLSATEKKFNADMKSLETSNEKMKELNADLDTVLDRLQQILSNNFAMDDSCFDNTQLRETASEMEGLLGTLIRGVEQRATLNSTRGMV